ncbi:MAG TPA: carbohydrate ABC transporter permease [Nocardioidaceae bacterium]|nr:carbohydrate ABC transporter permease [Nocardioidaceae bacterium]
MSAPEGKRSRSWFSIIMMVFLCILWSVPTLGLLISSFRPRIEIERSGWWTALFNPFSSDWTFNNYSTVLTEGEMDLAFINSIVVAIPATILPIMFAAFAAYAFTFMSFRGKDFIFVLIVALMVVPIQAAFVPLLTLFGPDGLGINGQFLAVWLLHTGFGMPLAIYTIRNYMSTLPRTVIESAKIDGATHFQTFWRLIVPMSIPVLAAFAILQFVWVWNDLLIALLFLGAGDNSTVIVNLASMLGTQGQGAELLTAGAFISMIVPLLVFFGLQRYFVRGLTAGAVKG